jgi:hypothetical protein
MKKLIFNGSILIIFGLTFVACKKDSRIPNQSNYGVQGSRESSQLMITKSLTSIKVVNGIYHFNDEQQFLDFLNNIELQDKEFQNQYYKLNSFLTEEQLNDKIEQTGWNEDLILDGLDLTNGVTSLRSKIKSNLDVWLKNGIDAGLDNPDVHVLTGRYVRSVVNENGQLVIADQIYIFSEDGTFLRINGLDYDLMEKINLKEIVQSNAPSKVIDISNGTDIIWSISGNTIPDCKANKSSGWKYAESDSKRVYGRVSINNIPYSHNIKAETQGYEKRKGNWRRYKTSVSAAIGTAYDEIRNEHCETFPFYGGSKSKNSREVETKSSDKNPIRAGTGEVKSVHVANGVSLSNTLTF